MWLRLEALKFKWGTPMLLELLDYPQLRLLAWSRSSADLLDEQDAFALYEREWRWIDQGSLLEKEIALIERLKRQYGHGVLNV
jgi:hypothetical protein